MSAGEGPAIGIDARKARDYGIGTYTRELVAALAALPRADGARFTLFVRPGDEPLFAALPPSFSLVPEEAAGYSPGELFGFGARIRRHRLSLFHALHYVLPVAIAIPAVVTIHDTIHLDFPGDGASPLRYPAARLLIRRALESAGAVIAPTAAVRDDLEELSPGAAGRIATILHGVSARFRRRIPRQEVERVRARYSLPDRYALYLGGARPHKNVAGTIEGFRRSQTPGLSLVLAGPMPAEVPAAPDDRIRRIGIVDESELPALYRGAELLLYPTLAEGFCFPLAEAMGCGVPAIVSDIPACREVAAGAARFVEPRDPSSIAEAIDQLSGDPAGRSAMAEKGLARAAELSWTRAAEATWRVYRRLLESP